MSDLDSASAAVLIETLQEIGIIQNKGPYM
jgi:hypothetical protein